MKDCPMCGSKEWKGPRYIEYTAWSRFRNWPCANESTCPLSAALQYQCSLCGYVRFDPTVADGGNPVTTTAIAVTDVQGHSMDRGD